ncbi:hypothetical protein FBU30_010279, partial [Linnemannia zychae]
MNPIPQLLSLVGWAFIPSWTARLLQAIYYAGRFGPDSPRLPRKNTPRFKRDFNIILIVAVALYLCSIVIESIRSIEPSHYETLDLKFHSFTQKQLKTNFRKASLQYHPDKYGEAGQEIFVKIRAAHEVLVDPTHRLAYNRFGPTVFKCTACKTNKDYLQEGLKGVSVFYVGTGVVLLLMNLLGKGTYGRYWRFILLCAMAAFEMSLIFTTAKEVGKRHGNYRMWIERCLPDLVTFEQINILHKIYITVSVAFTQVGPLICPSRQSKQEVSAALLKKLQTLTEIA